MAKFRKGFVFGALLGGVYTLLTAKQSGAATRQQLKNYVQQTKENVTDVNEKFANLQESLHRLANDGKAAFEEAQAEIQTNLRHFQEENKPRLRRIGDKLNQLTTHILEQTTDKN